MHLSWMTENSFNRNLEKEEEEEEEEKEGRVDL